MHSSRIRTLVAVTLTTTAAITGVAATGGPTEPATAVTATAAAAAPLTASTIRTATAAQVFSGGLYVQPDSQPAQAAAQLTAQGRTADAATARTIAAQPIAIWLGEWFTGDFLDRVIARNLAAAEAAGTTPVFVTYAIPNRDCGGYSAGGLTATTYAAWNRQIAADLRGHRAVVLVEPDSLAHLATCTSEASTRPALIAAAVDAYSAAGVPTYLDGGNENWNTPTLQASYLQQAGVAKARGFFTNVSNFYGVDGERAYAEQVSALTGGSRYVIDVSRNGRGWTGTWCNPSGAGLGQTPHATAGTTRLDALLWVKTPGASDGTCNGGPAAGTWFPQAAASLVAKARR